MKLIHELIAEYATVFPDKSAVTDPFGEITYGELEEKSAAVSAELVSLGVKRGDMVAVYVPYAKEIMVGAVSVFRTGCVFVPFDEAYPVNRLEYMLENCEAAALMTTHALWESKKLNFPDEKVIFLDDSHTAGKIPVQCNDLNEDSPAVLLYTSGTTGNPKGVQHSHRMLLHLADCFKAQDGLAMNSETRSGVIASFTFVAAQTFMMGPIVNGGTACIAPNEARKDMGGLYRFIKESRITHIFIPSGLAAIMAEDYDLSGVLVFAAGEKLRNFRAFSPENVVINLYGSTEATGIFTKRIHGDEERILVGKSYKNTKAMIVDENLKPVAQGEVGELLISNDYMSKGYYKLPELSAEKWVEADGLIWFRTGDRALCNDDGDYDILGRMDNMVKLRGFRIETGEVETQISNALNRLGISDVGQFVVVIKTLGGTEHLTCYYEAEEKLDKKALQKEIAGYLAEYMIPDVWVRMDELPRNVNGKVMRSGLPQPKREQKALGALDSEVLVRVLMTAADVLGTDYFIGPDDRFTDIGGTSLNAMQFSAALREQGIKIGGAQILQYNVLRKIADMAEVAYEQLWSIEEYREIRKDFASRGEHIQKVFPISAKQDEMLFEQIIYPDSPGFKDAFFLQVDSIVSEQSLRNALDIVAEENEELRSSIVFHNVSVIQQVVTDRKIPLKIIEADKIEIEKLDDLREQTLNVQTDLQYDSMMKVICLHAENMSFLYFLTNYIAISDTQLRSYIVKLMSELEKDYPEDSSIRGWREVLEIEPDCEENTVLSGAKKSVNISANIPDDICVYSENNGQKVVFVHTGNTGSSAYYRLADRIGDKVSFAVIEPYNLYHPDTACYGIKNIAENYIRILKKYQPNGPYILGGWCYGGVVAHEMACRLLQAGEEVRHLFMLDSHALGNAKLKKLSKGMLSEINVKYFETCPLFAELRESGMLEAMIQNAVHVSEDLYNHIPSFYNGSVTYFKPDSIPSGATGDNFKYWNSMMKFEAGNYENYCEKGKMHIIHTPHEHDLMMDDASLDIIVPALLKSIN